MTQRKTSARFRWLLFGGSIGFLLSLLVGGYFYWLLLAGNVRVSNNEQYAELKIPRGATYSEVLDSLRAHRMLRNESSFEQVARLLKYPSLVKFGYYRLKRGTGNLSLVRKLRAGAQSTQQLRIREARTPAALAGQLARQLESDSLAWLTMLRNDTLLARYKTPSGEGFSTSTVLALFLPNTYEVYWTTSPERLLARMHTEYTAYWTDSRIAKAEAKGLNPLQVSILASIVMEENLAHPDEWPRIAGVYINRLDRGMRLQADPTVKYAVGDFTLKRVLNRHLEVDSPYNTYRYDGLPPGPINCPNTRALEAVLNAEKHSYLYFVATPGYGGYHQFSKTLAEHNRYADLYRKWLNQQGIR